MVSTNDGLMLLKKEGILKEHPTGGHFLESTPNSLNFSLPLSLKDKPTKSWSKEEQIWLNT